MSESKRVKPIGICWECGKRLLDAVGRPVNGVLVMVGGNPVRIHKACAAAERSRTELAAIEVKERHNRLKSDKFCGRQG